MVLPKDTNTVYLSKLLERNAEFAGAFACLTDILDRHAIKWKLLESTKDIWCRDYMPIQIEQGKFVQFRYQPSYLKGFAQLQSEPATVLHDNGIEAGFSNINLDGGNLVCWTDRGIVSDRIFDENPEYPDGKDLVDELERLLGVEIIVIPQIRSDMTGHADGLVRFLNRSTLIGNDRQMEYAYWTKKIARMLKDHNLDYIDIPFFDGGNKRQPQSAIGCYINFLEVAGLVLLPVFGHNEMDNAAFKLVKSLYPDRTVEVIEINAIGVQGGLLNCISWTIRQ